MLSSKFRLVGKTFLVPLLLAALAGCATSPTGRSQLLVFPAEELDSMGIKAFDEMRAQLSEEQRPQFDMNRARHVAESQAPA